LTGKPEKLRSLLSSGDASDAGDDHHGKWKQDGMPLSVDEYVIRVWVYQSDISR